MGVWIETEIKHIIMYDFRVTPCMGVWIETPNRAQIIIRSMRYTLYGCVDWNINWNLCIMARTSHTLYGCVDWNHLPKANCNRMWSHTLYGCVDWNISLWLLVRRWRVTPCMGVWIETLKDHPYTNKTLVTPCMGVWIETRRIMIPLVTN